MDCFASLAMTNLSLKTPRCLIRAMACRSALAIAAGVELANRPEAVRCRFERRIDVGSLMRRRQEHVVLRMKERAVTQGGRAERPSLAKFGIAVEQHQRHLRRTALADRDPLARREP